jgi:hypothetical protein
VPAERELREDESSILPTLPSRANRDRLNYIRDLFGVFQVRG